MTDSPARPTIEYPCQWAFRLIGVDDDRLRAVIEDVLEDRDHTVKAGNLSATGKYCSIEASAEVLDECDRDRIFGAFSAAEGVLAVM